MKLALIRSTNGCAHCAPVEVDPYWRAVEDGADWHDCARGDGHSYGGVVEWMPALPGETPEQLEARAWERVRALRHEGYGCEC